jgi:anti-sigma factor RsiW
MMDCKEFLASHSAYRDGELSWPEREACEAHLDACEACARYDRVVWRGAELVRDLPRIEVSEDFGERLRHRLYHVEEEMRAPRFAVGGAGTAASTLAIAAVLAMAAWIPLMQPRDRVVELPGVAARAPDPRGVVDQIVAPVHVEATRLTSHLAQIGVAVQELPYHDLVFRPRGPLVGQLAVMEPQAQ